MPPASVGRIVLVNLRSMGEPQRYNGSDEHPAIITAVFGGENDLVNVRVFVDGETNPLWQPSIPREDVAGSGYGGSTWRWPPRLE